MLFSAPIIDIYINSIHIGRSTITMVWCIYFTNCS